MITLVVTLLCARLIAAAFGAVLGLALAVVGLAVEVAWAAARWVLWPALVLGARVVRGLTVGRGSGLYTPATWRWAPRPARGGRALARQAALLAGTRAARA